MNKRRTPSEPTSEQHRKEIEEHLSEYLKSGKAIQQIPSGVSGQDPLGRSRQHITLGSSKKRAEAANAADAEPAAKTANSGKDG
jgi:hypothetical protein